MIYVSLISHTPDPERTIAAAARVSTSPIDTKEISKQLTPQAIDRLFTHLLNSGHLSTFEHASFTFAIEGISRVTSHQLVRHRMASYTQQSQRYLSLKKADYITPRSISARKELESKYHDMVRDCHRLYLDMLDAGIPAEDVTEDLISQHLYTASQPDPDLIIRTGGEFRLSNFLLWQAWYAEYYSTPVYWPDFDETELYKALVTFGQRKRRYGLVPGKA